MKTTLAKILFTGIALGASLTFADSSSLAVTGESAKILFLQYQYSSLSAGSKYTLQCGNFGGGVNRKPQCYVIPEGKAKFTVTDPMEVRSLTVALALAGINTFGGAEYHSADVVCASDLASVGDQNLALCVLSNINK